MAEYFPCHWCGVDVTATPPQKIAVAVGNAAAVSKPDVLWDRNGGKHSEGRCATDGRSNRKS